MRRRWLGIWGIGVLLSAALAGCGDEAEDGSTEGAPSSTSAEAAAGTGGAGGSPPGAGGAGGGEAPPDCEAPTTAVDGACVAALGEFQQVGSLAAARDHHVTFVVDADAGRFLYVHGGAVDMADFVTTTERAPILADGSLGPFETVGPDFLLGGHGVAVRGDRVLFFGGQRALGSTPRSYLLDVRADGTLSDPVETEPLAAGHFHVGGVQVGDLVFAVGGIEDREDGSFSVATVEVTTFGDDGISPWRETTPLPRPRSHHVVTAHDGFLYVAGGLDRPGSFTGDVSLPDVLRAPIGEGGELGAWETVATLPMDLAVAAATTVGDQLWIVGGLVDGAHDHQGPTGELTTFTAAVHRATVTDGLLGPFEIVGQLPRARGHCHQVPVVDGVLYSVGGHDEGRSQPEAYAARFE